MAALLTVFFCLLKMLTSAAEQQSHLHQGKGCASCMSSHSEKDACEVVPRRSGSPFLGESLPRTRCTCAALLHYEERRAFERKEKIPEYQMGVITDRVIEDSGRLKYESQSVDHVSLSDV